MFTISLSTTHSGVWVVKDINNKIRKYAYSEEEAQQWVKEQEGR